MALLLDIHKTSARTLVRRSSAEPSWTVRDVFAAAAEIVRRGTNVCRLLTTDSQLIDEDSTITDMGLVPGVYQGWCWCPGFYTFYSLDLTEDGDFVLTRWVVAESSRYRGVKATLQNCKVSGHLAGNGVFVLDTIDEEMSDCDIALQLCDDGRSVKVTGPVAHFIHQLHPTRVVREEVCMNLSQCHSKPERLTDLPGLLPQAQPLKFQDGKGNGGYSFEIQHDGSFQLTRQEDFCTMHQTFVITGRFDDSEFQYSLDPLDHSKQSQYTLNPFQGDQSKHIGNITEKEMELAWSVLHMYIGDGGRVLLDGLRGPVFENPAIDGEGGKPATAVLSFF